MYPQSQGDMGVHASTLLSHIKLTLGDDVAGHSLCLGGATVLALTSVPIDYIQAHGRWSSDTYCSYIRKYPVMLQMLLYGQSAFDNQN